MISLVDQLGTALSLSDKPKRIVSLVPSQTELLYALGLDQEVVGITRFCTRPDSWRVSKTRIGGTKTLDLSKIQALQPDLIIGNKEENVQSQIDFLRDSYPVFMSDVNTLGDALEMIQMIGVLTRRELEATCMVQDMEERFHSWSQAVGTEKPLRVAYVIWQEPWMCVGQQTFIHDMIRRCGMVNVFAHRDRYPVTSLEEIKSLEPDLIALSSEPFPFTETHRLNVQQQLPNSRCHIVNGEFFSWYGSRLLETPGYFRQLRGELSV